MFSCALCAYRGYTGREMQRHELWHKDQFNHAIDRLRKIQDEEKKMNDQMEQVWRSKDGRCTGSKEEVEAYLKSKNPLGKMQFPITYGSMVDFQTANAIVAFANLAPLIQKVLETWGKESDNAFPGWRNANHTYRVSAGFIATTELLLAYEEALKQVPQ